MGERLALGARHGAQERAPVADLLPAVAAVALDLLPRQSEQRLDVAALDVIDHPVIPLRVDSPGLGRADPVRDTAGRHEGPAGRAGVRARDAPAERAHFVAT